MQNSEQELEEAKTVLRKEAIAIQEIANRLDSGAFCKSIDILFETHGKIVITGIGKSGHVGKKMEDMLCSTG